MSTIDATREPAESGRVASEKTSTSHDRAAAGMDTAGTTGRRGLRYIPGLDGIRAIAVLAVLLYHADVPWMPGGFLGVDMFFVLSGFLITSIVLTELDGTGRLDFKRFYIHRARRLLPAMFVVLALAASGRTSFTCTVLAEAKKAGALTIGIANNPDVPLLTNADIAIPLLTGGEALAGSTRLKAATAQKICLNMISTLVMTRLGRVRDGKMIAMRPTNAKLRDRFARIHGEETNS